MIRGAIALIVLAALTVAPSLAMAKSRGGGGKGGSVTVKPHVRKDGAYVGGHKRTAPDASKTNNWSTKGNVNPYTGKQGSK